MPGGAAELHANRFAALAVVDLDWRPCGVGRPAVAPLHQRNKGWEQLEALVSQAVLVASSVPRFAIRLTGHDALVHEGAKPIAEDVSSAAQRTMEVREATNSVEGLPEDEQRPFLPHDLEGPLDRAIVGRKAKPVGMHSRQGS